MDDVELLQRARRGDEAALVQLFTRHQGAIYRYAAYMCGRDTADDIVQETFLAVLQQKARRDAPLGAVISYLMGIARHRIQKRAANANEVQSEEFFEAMTRYVDADRSTPLDDLARLETIQTVRAPPPLPPPPPARPSGGVRDSGAPPPPPPPPRPDEESLGTRHMEGLTVTGRRSRTTIPAGHIGNDRPIEVIDERWESSDLRVLVWSRHHDPRTGDVEYRLTNIRRAEPPAGLFAVPDNYTIVDAPPPPPPPPGSR